MNRRHHANDRRDHYAVVRLYWWASGPTGRSGPSPVMRCYRPGDAWQTRMWDVELGAAI